MRMKLFPYFTRHHLITHTNLTHEFIYDVILVILFPSNILSNMSFCLHNQKNITRQLEDTIFIFLWQKQYFTHSLRSFVKYCFATQK